VLSGRDYFKKTPHSEVKKEGALNRHPPIIFKNEMLFN
jgi:hypothetical protein